MDIQLHDDFDRVCPQSGASTEPGCRPLGAKVELSGGRGEFVSFQVALPVAGKGQTARLSPSDLSGPGRIPASSYDLFVQWYVPAAKGNGTGKPPAARKYIPDGLLPVSVFDGRVPLGVPANKVPGQTRQGVWVDLFIPKDAKPGRYEGRLTVQADGESSDVPVALDVLDFTCPDTLSLPFLMNNYADGISRGWAGLRDDLDRHQTKRYRDIERTFWQVAHDHRSAFYYLPYTHSGYIYPTFAPPLTGGGPNKRVQSWADWDRHFGPYFDGSAFKTTRRGTIPVPRFFLPISLDWPASFLKYGRPGYADEFRAVARQMAEHFKARGWSGTDFDMFLNHKQRYKLYPWDCEEVRFLEDNDVHRYFATLWKGTLDHASTAPVRFNYSNGCTWTIGLDTYSDLSEFTDFWIGGSTGPSWYAERVAELQARGVEFCSCTGGGDIASGPRAVAWWPLKFWMGGLDSFMLWLSIGWGADPWNAPPDGGGTLLLYPGDEFGLDAALPAQRLKVMRNMLQTVERLELAGRKVEGGPAEMRRRVNQVMGMGEAADWFGPKPDYADVKLPKDWTRADFATEEPPASGWQDKTAEQFRRIGRMAAAAIASTPA